MVKKYLVFLLLLWIGIEGISAQTEKGVWMLNPQFTAFDLSGTENSSNQSDLFRLGVGFKGGNFLANDLLLQTGIGFQIERQGGYKNNALDISVGLRYYILSRLFMGAELGYEQQWIRNNGVSHYRHPSYLIFGLEAGYAFFINRTFAFEPGIYWEYSFIDRFMQYGLKLGFGVYF